ncbi:MAG: hypothetical protein Q7U41_01825 [Microbacterium sp.]|nr:hypothetical protein [Microbacterium sp.]
MSEGALPRGTRLLHIGLPKTGTTSIQYAAHTQRQLLGRHGVVYPGRELNHNRQVSAAIGRVSELWAEPPSVYEWHALLRELRARPGDRALISYEQLTEASPRGARRLVRALGRRRTHVVITVRALGTLLPSVWQQYVKTGYSGRFDTWAADMLADPPRLGGTPSFWIRHDATAQLAKWIRAAGRDRVTVVIPDGARPEVLTNAFERMLDLPEGLLRVAMDDGYGANRSLSGTEAEIVRRLNARLDGREVPLGQYNRYVTQGAVARVQRHAAADVDDGRVRLPPELAPRVMQLQQQFADRLERSGVRVIGDRSQLIAAPATGADDVASTIETRTAAEFVLGMISRIVHRGIEFGDLEYLPPVPVDLDEIERFRLSRHIRQRLRGEEHRVG